MADETTPKEAKLTVKAGDREVHLEARPEIVRAELDRVLDRLFQPGEGPAGAGSPGGEPSSPDPVVVSVTAPRPGPAAPSREAPAPEAVPALTTTALDAITLARGHDNVSPQALALLRRVTLDPARFKDLYSVDPRGKVCLLAMPRTAEPVDDLLMLLLYGGLTLQGKARGLGGDLLHAARSLGLKLSRVPRSFGRDDDRVAITGFRRRRRYRLTAAGIRHCEALIGKLLTQ